MENLSWSEIQGIIPHRYPILLIDSVLTLVPDHSVVAIKAVTGTEACYAHVREATRPEEIAYPYSLILESAGQAAAILWRLSAQLRGSTVDGVLMFGAAKEIIFEGLVYPGETMEHRIRQERAVADTLFFSAETWVGERRIARMGWLIAVAKPPGVLKSVGAN